MADMKSRVYIPCAWQLQAVRLSADTFQYSVGATEAGQQLPAAREAQVLGAQQYTVVGFEYGWLMMFVIVMLLVLLHP